MNGNKQAYDEAYQRALEGRSRSVWDFFLRPFEDQYTRQSREKGAREGAAARAQAAQDQTGSPQAN